MNAAKRFVDLREEARRCLLCYDSPCSKVCSNSDPARAVRAIRFDNASVAGRWLADASADELLRAEQACIHYDRPIRIREIAAALKPSDTVLRLPSLEVDFCGIRCENPFFLASSSICTNYDMVASALRAGSPRIIPESLSACLTTSRRAKATASSSTRTRAMCASSPEGTPSRIPRNCRPEAKSRSKSSCRESASRESW